MSTWRWLIACSCVCGYAAGAGTMSVEDYATLRNIDGRLGTLDWVFVALYFVICFGIAAWYSRRASSNTTEFFLSGRTMPWWLAGTSMVATTFAADTPLFVTELVAEDGIAGNWMWWSTAFGGVLTVFFFADLWSKSGVVTDVELCEMRYDGPAAAVLRGVKAVYFGIIMNVLVCGWVSLGMESVVRTLIPDLPIDPIVFVAILMFITAIFSMMAGLTGVTITDSFQFVIAITGSILLASYAIDSVGGLNALVQRYTDLGDAQALNMVAQLGEKTPEAKFYNFRCNSVPYNVPCNVTSTTMEVHHGFQLVHNEEYYESKNCASGTCTSVVVARPGAVDGQQFSKVFSTGP